MIKFKSVSWIALLMLLGGACKTSSQSSPNALPLEQITSLSLAEWVVACQSELDNIETGEQSKAELQLLANTTDCASAYPIVKRIIETYSKR